MKNSLLSYIASNFISEYENVANSCIAYLLNEYSNAQKALEIILEMDSVPTYYMTELSTDNNGRPDVTGLDINNNKSVIIEGKFWANLTDNQPANYIEEISEDGKLLFLAPEKRISSLKIDVSNRLNGDTEKVVISSWKNFLNLIESENKKNFSHQLESDLIQIKELCQKMDTEGMPPLSLSDLDPMNGRIAAQFADIIDECNPIIRYWEVSDFKGLKSTSTRYGYGFYFRCFSFTCFLYADSQNWFTRPNHTPIWLWIKDANWEIDQKINNVLNNLDSSNSFDNEYGITLRVGLDRKEIVDLITSKTKNLLIRLNEQLINNQ
jgi:hypothetical protein